MPTAIVTGAGGLVGAETSARLCEAGFDVVGVARIGDHRWWIGDLDEFRADYPDWKPEYDVERILREIHAENAEEWAAETAARS